ncbi:MAG: hypothetical protein ACI814_004631 [Mariniblastus sp.]|jgi:hypothetical protein
MEFSRLSIPVDETGSEFTVLTAALGSLDIVCPVRKISVSELSGVGCMGAIKHIIGLARDFESCGKNREDLED